MKKIITDEQIGKILNLINQRKILEAKDILNELEEDKLEDALKKLIRNSGRSSHIPISNLKQILIDNE